jgi:Trk K+ transport system NAD-binding subunit
MHTGLKIRLAIHAARNYLLVIFIFIAIGFAYFCVAHTDWGLGGWLQATFFIQTDIIKTDPIAGLYTMFGTVVVMQGILALVFSRFEQANNPAKTARSLAHHMDDHVVVLGYGHFGKTIYKYFEEHGHAIAVIEKDENVVKELMEDGGAVVVGDASDPSVLAEVNLKHAHDVVQTFNDMRTSLIVAHYIHKLNPKCEFWTRCKDDKMNKILADLGAKPFSTSQWITTKLREDLPPPTEAAVLVGYNNISARFIQIFKEEKRSVMVIDDNPKKIAELRAQDPDIQVIQGTLTAKATLAAVESARVAIICIEDREDETLLIVREMLVINPKLVIYARMYDEALVQVIESMGGHSFSSSKFACAKLKDDLCR